jgi:hypothetical protein
MNRSRSLSVLRLFGWVSRVNAPDYFLFADQPARMVDIRRNGLCKL